MRWVHRAALSSVVVFSSVAAACSVSSPSGPTAASPEASSAAQQETCSRDQLNWVAVGYLNVLTAHTDPADLPLSPDLKLTENGEQIEPGEGFWQTAGATRFMRSALDTETCGAHTLAVMEEDGTDVIIGVRLRIGDNAITEIETYVTRVGDYAFFDPSGLIALDDGAPGEVAWDDPVPEEQRSTREELIDFADGYYESFGGEVQVPMDNDCYRRENGQTTASGDCGTGIGVGSPAMITNRRYPLVDVEAGIAVGYVIFAGGLDFHMFKVVDGEIRLIDALVTASGHDSSGWEEQEDPA